MAVWRGTQRTTGLPGESLDRGWGPRSPGACALRSRSEKLREPLFLAHFCVSVSVVCCYCTMLSITFVLFSVLLLVPSAVAVCQHCFGEAASLGCKDDGNCPWVTGIADNASMIQKIVAGTATAATFKVATLLPNRFRRLFPRNVLEVSVHDTGLH